eukprot:1108321-Rhodomonas_salina.2
MRADEWIRDLDLAMRELTPKNVPACNAILVDLGQMLLDRAPVLVHDFLRRQREGAVSFQRPTPDAAQVHGQGVC